MAANDYPIDPIDFSTPRDANKVVAIEAWTEGDVEMATVEFTDGEIQSMPMSKAEARAKADRCLGPDEITSHRRTVFLTVGPACRGPSEPTPKRGRVKFVTFSPPPRGVNGSPWDLGESQPLKDTEGLAHGRIQGHAEEDRASRRALPA